MKKPSLQDMVFHKTIPNPKQNDPVSFFGHVQRNLVPEVRLEVQTFYGSLDCLEAQYPGLDYTFPPHRRRLARYPWHRRLFRTFDELRLTDGEILSLCQWEGTRSAKERYETETKRQIRDTTADDVQAAPVGEGPRARIYFWNGPSDCPSSETVAQIGAMDLEAEAEQSDEDEITSSIGVQLNQQLQAAVEARSRGDPVSVDEQWEQWMKEAIERNEFDRDAILQAIREGRPFPDTSAGTSRRNTSLALEADSASIRSSGIITAARTTTSQRYDDLRTMLHDLQSTNDQLVVDNAAMAMLLSRSRPETAR